MVQQIYSTKIYAVLVFLFAVHTAGAQHHHDMPAMDKNVYLSIMDTMMVNMDKALGAATIEADFVNQMIPHHEGAVAMAKYEIKNGKDFAMIQLAKSILQEQTIELQQMRIWIKQPFAPSVPVTKTYPGEMQHTMDIMMQNMPDNAMLNNPDRAFAMVMLPHHQAAIDMAKVLLKYSKNSIATSFAKHLISSEQIEIEQMQLYIK
ncbi:DUF305 domain-containing protein [Flavobacterium rivuli]|uniref:DUF305 domain-containing protein n=1 Tax=Flavobacterium rivuli TaxID=498301 RepID=UPI0003754089|nr:DUF305 domain-containing protein [Flavobacterium rivuli]